MNTIWARHALLPSGWERGVRITVDQGRIQDVAVDAVERGPSVGILLPAPVNVHSHAFQRAIAGLTEARGTDAGDSFWTWRKLMYSFLQHLKPEHVQAITALVQMEMLEAGFATNTEFHYLHNQADGAPYDNLSEMSERVAAAADQTGIGLCHLSVLYEFGGCDGRALGAGQIRFGNDLDRFLKLHEGAAKAVRALPDDAQIGVAPHSLRAVSQADLRQIAQLFPSGPVHMHLAEQRGEVDEVKAVWRARPVEWALSNLDIDKRWCLIHCTQMTPEETKDLAQTGATAGLCPITESNLGDGIFNGTSWLDAGGRFAIGSDSNIRISLTEELRTLEYSQRLRDKTRAALATPNTSTGRRVFDEMLLGGARATGRQTGAIQPGLWADLVALDDASLHLDGLAGDAILDRWIFAGGDSLVRDVWSAGRHVVQEGRHIHRDTIAAGFRNVQRALVAGI